MKEERDLTADEVSQLEKLLQDEMGFIKKLVVGASIFALFSPWVPLGLTRQGQRSGVSGNLMEYAGGLEAYSMAIFCSAALVAFFYFHKPAKIKKDLEKRKAIVAAVKVGRVERLKPSLAKQMANGEDTILHFVNNQYGVKNIYFKSTERPELVSAQKLVVERALHSKIEFKTEIV